LSQAQLGSAIQSGFRIPSVFPSVALLARFPPLSPSLHLTHYPMGALSSCRSCWCGARVALPAKPANSIPLGGTASK
jgi:hypothetical protein